MPADSTSGAARHGGGGPVSGAGRSGLCAGNGVGPRRGGIEGRSGEELAVLPARGGDACAAAECGGGRGAASCEGRPCECGALWAFQGCEGGVPVGSCRRQGPGEEWSNAPGCCVGPRVWS